ncbi:alpha/beta hydrolase [Nonomuraea sp. NPDC046570]|uniref:alpha/beta fold hydrolase n=1 Tax=Nonomuraea sp. NPDC046570 TaxID=3155255 RepID=UPI0033D82298
MADYVDLDGVRTWYGERGEGEPLVLMHGGFSDSRDFAGNLGTLADRFRVLTPERRGHGHTPDHDGPITHDLMAQDMIAFIEKVAGGPAHLAGYSDGATVAMLVALRRPDLVRRLVLVSGAYDLSGYLFAPQPGGEFPEQVVAAYAEVSPDGREHFPVVVAKMLDPDSAPLGLDEEALRGIGALTLVMSGDDDLVRLEHTLSIYRAVPSSELAIVPGTSHVLLHEEPALVTELVADFLTTDPAPTILPIRRGQPSP